MQAQELKQNVFNHLMNASSYSDINHTVSIREFYLAQAAKNMVAYYLLSKKVS